MNRPAGKRLRVVGLMSGTSLDGVDAAVVDIEERGGGSFGWELRGFATRPYDPEARARIRSAFGHVSAADLCRLRVDLAGWSAEAAEAACNEGGIAVESLDLAGSHGQTLWHEPPHRSRRGASLQLDDPATLAGLLRVPVVSDFRSADLAAGGHGAPLVPWADRALFGDDRERRALQNLGGIANVTWLPRKGDPDSVLAFDTGPGVALIDRVATLASSGAESFDVDGVMGLEGVSDPALLETLLAHPFFSWPPPRSTGREEFGDDLVDELVEAGGLRPGRDRPAWTSLMATLVQLTARSIGEAYREWVIPRGLDAVYMMGGGARNPALRAAIRRELPELEFRDSESLGVDPDAREAIAFALLAWAHVRRIPSNVPEATGARAARVLGSLTPAPGAGR